MTDEKTIEYIESRLRDNPKSLHFARLADYYIKQQRIEDAIELCLEGMKHHPSYVTGSFVLAKAYMAQGEQEKAEAEYKKVLTHDQQFLAAHRQLGDLMAKTGWENKAVMHYKDILRIDPLDGETRQILTNLTGERRFPVTPREQPKEEFIPTPEKEESAGIETTKEEAWTQELEDVFSTDDSSISQADLPTIDKISEQDTLDESSATFETEPLEQEPLPLDIPDEFKVTEDAEESATTGIEPLEQESLSMDLPDVFKENGDKQESSTESHLIEDESTIDLSTEESTDAVEDEFSFDITDVASESKMELETGEDLTDDNLLFEDDLALHKPADETPLAPETQPVDEGILDVSGDLQIDAAKKQQKPETPLASADETTALDLPPEEGDEEGNQGDQKIVSPTLGEIYAAQGQYAKAIKIYESLLKSNPDEEGRYREKIEALRKKLDESS